MTRLAEERPFLEHLREIRRRFMVSLGAVGVGFVIAIVGFDYWVGGLMAPFKSVSSVADHHLFVTGLFESFLTKIKLSFLMGIVLSSPVHIFNLTRFIFPALQKKEKWVFGIAVISSFGLSVLAFYLSYFKLIPFSVQFMTGASLIPEHVGILFNYNQNIFYIFNFVIYALLLFQSPILLEVLLAMNLISRKALLRQSRFIILGIFVLSALVTPPDFISQVGLSLPLIGLFFLTILVAKCFGWGKVA